MKNLHRLLFVLILVGALALALPGPAQAAVGDRDDKVVFGGNYTLSSGETLDGNLAVFGGSANIEEGAVLNGDVFVMGGSVNINGEVDGNVSTVGGTLFLGEQALVEGDISTFGGTVHQEEGADVRGEIVEGTNRPFDFDFPNRVFPPRINVDPFWRFSSFLAQTLAMAALAVLIALAAPNATNRVAHTAVNQPLLAGGLGLLTIILAPIVILFLLITILLIPVGLILILLLAAATVFGYIGIGLEVGRRLAVMVKGSWTPPLAAGIGTLVVGLVVGLIGQIPCIGWLLGFGIAMVGLGAVLLTRFGTKFYPPDSAVTIPPASPIYPAAPTTVVPPAAPVSPVQPSVVDVYPAAPQSPAAPHVDVYPAPGTEEPRPAGEDPTLPA